MPYTTRGLSRRNDAYYRRQEPLPDHFYVALVTETDGLSPSTNLAPTVATKTFDELNEIAAGNGYTAGGFELDPGTVDFDALTEDDVNGIVELSIKNIVWSASGGDIPDSGDPARYVVLLAEDPNSPLVLGSRAVIWYASLGRDRVALNGEDLTLTGLDIREKGGSLLRSSTPYTVTLASVATNTVTLSPAVDPDKAYILPNGFRYTAGTPTIEGMMANMEITNSTTATITKGDAVGTVVYKIRVIDPY